MRGHWCVRARGRAHLATPRGVSPSYDTGPGAYGTEPALKVITPQLETTKAFDKWAVGAGFPVFLDQNDNSTQTT